MTGFAAERQATRGLEEGCRIPRHHTSKAAGIVPGIIVEPRLGLTLFCSLCRAAGVQNARCLKPNRRRGGGISIMLKATYEGWESVPKRCEIAEGDVRG